MKQIFRLRKHADFQRVYQKSRKQFSRQMTFFFALREADPVASALPAGDQPAGAQRTVGEASGPGPRIGLTVGKVMGKAVDRNRIKRRMREAVRHNLGGLNAPVDVVLHPRRAVIDTEFAGLEREVADVFRTIQATLARRSNRAAEEAR